ncbi:hypothetical protein [Brumimicrobium aurantiacum]|uniref:hypothetical protein n=1 Tax=Brumimicrobium aurantiacum TaxID=1737063 RepID=UPI0014021899|nr:hypothetical protein [Brumimicrobium aurantiacum]
MDKSELNEKELHEIEGLIQHIIKSFATVNFQTCSSSPVNNLYPPHPTTDDFFVS